MAQGDRALVRNAADPAQVKRAARKEQDRAEAFKAALRAVLDTPAGRYVLGELLERGRLYETSFDHSGSVVYFREGRRNFALEIQAECIAADEKLFDWLERERRTRRRLEETENAAVHTPAAAASGGTNGE